jgi:ATP-binding cassette, subfamily C, bacterial LapB
MSEQSTTAWLWPFLQPMKSVFREVLAMSMFVNFLALAVPVFTLQVYDRVVFHAGISTLKGLVIGMALVLLFDFVLRQSRTRIMQIVALKVVSDVSAFGTN